MRSIVLSGSAVEDTRAAAAAEGPGEDSIEFRQNTSAVLDTLATILAQSGKLINIQSVRLIIENGLPACDFDYLLNPPTMIISQVAKSTAAPVLGNSVCLTFN